MSRIKRALLIGLVAVMPLVASAQAAQKWATSWAASVQGPYPHGNPNAQPNLSFAFPAPETGARDQTFRLIVRPTIWSKQTRLRFSNAFGSKPVTFEGAFVGLQHSSAVVVPGTNRAVTFGGKASVTVPPGGSTWSDPVNLTFVKNPDAPELAGRKLAVSFHVAGESGPMTWHAKAINTSYISPPGSGAHGARHDEEKFPYSTASWFFVDAVDMKVPADTKVVVAFGDSITDGTSSTMNGDDRWPDVLSRRLHAVYGNRVAVLNAGIGGNQVVGPKDYDLDKPFRGGPSALSRLERDVLSLSGVSTVIWLEGTNDFSKNGNATAEAVKAGMTEGVARIRATIPGVRVIGATVVTALGSTSAAHGFAEQDQKRRELNAFIRESKVFDAVADFDRVTLDPQTGELRAEMVPDSTVGGQGDKLHPNRAGYLAMGSSIDLETLVGKRPSH